MSNAFLRVEKSPAERRGWRDARALRLSTCAAILFALAFILPWGAYAWITTADRSARIESTFHNLAALAAAYGEHATSLMRLGIAVPIDGEPLGAAAPTRGEVELSAFRAALNAPSVRFVLRRSENGVAAITPGEIGPDLTPTFRESGGTLFAEIDRPAAGLVAVAALDETDALKQWRSRAIVQAIALVLRSLLVVVLGWVIVRQLRYRESIEAQLAAAKTAAEAASRAKSEFLANMSHELRTPLNAIIGFSEVIMNRTFGSSSERYHDYAADIFKSGHHLLALINDILNLSKLEAGQFKLEEEEVDIAAIVATSIKFVETQAKRGRIQLIVSLEDDIGCVRADERRLRQILINLLSNAVKFTPEGGRVSVLSRRLTEGLVIAVSDTGIGMAREDIAKAMTPFGQIDSRISRKYEGTGLGLPLAKQLVELHGGRLSVESRLSVGTTVTIELPPERLLPRQAVKAVLSSRPAA